MSFRDDVYTTRIVFGVLIGFAMLCWFKILEWFCDSVPLPIKPKKKVVKA